MLWDTIFIWRILKSKYNFQENLVWFTSITVFVLPSVMIVCLYILILCELWTGSTIKKMKLETRKNEKQLSRKEIRVTIIVGILTFAFLICCWPWMIFFTFFQYRTDQNQEFLNSIRPLVANLGLFGNSLINPLLYMILSKDIRRTLYYKITCKKVPAGTRSRIGTGTTISSWYCLFSWMLSIYWSQFPWIWS